MKRLSFAFLPAIAVLAVGCASGPTQAELLDQEKAAMGSALGVAVARLEPMDHRFKTLERDNIANHAGLKKADLWDTRLDDVDLRGTTGELIRARVLRIPLRAPAGPGTAYFAFDPEGRLIQSALLSERLDRDRRALWPGFTGQFAGSLAASTADFRTPAAAFALLREAETAADGRVRALYDLRRLQAENRSRQAQVMHLTGRGELPSSDLLRDWGARFFVIQELAAPLALSFDPTEVRALPGLAEQAQGLIAQAAFAAESGQAGEIRRLIGGELEAVLADMESITGGPLGSTTANRRWEELGAPRVFRAGHDVWAPPGREESAQYLASLHKAALLLAGLLQRDNQL